MVYLKDSQILTVERKESITGQSRKFYLFALHGHLFSNPGSEIYLLCRNNEGYQQKHYWNSLVFENL